MIVTQREGRIHYLLDAHLQLLVAVLTDLHRLHVTELPVRAVANGALRAPIFHRKPRLQWHSQLH